MGGVGWVGGWIDGHQFLVFVVAIFFNDLAVAVAVAVVAVVAAARFFGSSCCR